MSDHLPDCDDFAFSGAGFHPNCERICICRQVRRVERRVIAAAREAVAAWFVANRDEMTWPDAQAAIDALRGEL